MVNCKSAVIEETRRFVQSYLANHDASHDWQHIERVTKNSFQIAKEEIKSSPLLDLELIELAALLHDIGDFKYSKE